MIHEPAIVALETVQSIMDKYEPKHNGAWTKQTLVQHITHALDHALSFNKTLFNDNHPSHLTPEQIEDVESCLTRCAFILASIKRDAQSDVPSIDITLPEALES